MRLKLIVTFFTSATSIFAISVKANTAATAAATASADPSDDLEKSIRNENYPVERHSILTADGYFLTVHRIPGAKNSIPVYLQHGFLSSSADWFIAGRKKALPYILSDNGYDVWAGNARGNHFSKSHKTLSKDDPEFWDFSWSEVGLYDIPAVITYISNLTNSRIYYVGHSMGCTTFSVMASRRPDVAGRVKKMVALAPAIYEFHISHPAVKLLSKFLPQFQSLAYYLGLHQFLPRSRVFDFLANDVRGIPVIYDFLLAQTMYVIDGVVPVPEKNASLPNIAKTFPSGTSMKLFVHWLQQMNVDEFQDYDYGKDENFEVYGSPEPPKYDLSKVQVPVAVFYSGNDLITTPKDVLHFYEQLPLKLGSYEIDSLTHADFLWRERAVELVYRKILNIFR